MPDLSSLLRDHADSFDVRNPDPAELAVALRHRRRRRRAAIGVFTAAALVVAVPTVIGSVRAPQPSTADSSPPAGTSDSPDGSSSGFAAVRTDADGRGLVIPGSFGCGTTTARAEETSTSVDVELWSVPPPGNVACALNLLVGATFSAQLEAPLGGRTLTSDGHPLIPFDGATLLTLPAGNGVFGETGEVDEPAPGTWRTRAWTRFVGPVPVPATTGDSCAEDRISYDLTQSIDQPDGNSSPTDTQWTDVAETRPDGTVLQALGGGFTPSVRFDNGSGSVTLSLSSQCADATAATAALVAVARELS